MIASDENEGSITRNRVFFEAIVKTNDLQLFQSFAKGKTALQMIVEVNFNCSAVIFYATQTGKKPTQVFYLDFPRVVDCSPSKSSPDMMILSTRKPEKGSSGTAGQGLLMSLEFVIVGGGGPLGSYRNALALLLSSLSRDNKLATEFFFELDHCYESVYTADVEKVMSFGKHPRKLILTPYAILHLKDETDSVPSGVTPYVCMDFARSKRRIAVKIDIKSAGESFWEHKDASLEAFRIMYLFASKALLDDFMEVLQALTTQMQRRAACQREQAIYALQCFYEEPADALLLVDNDTDASGVLRVLRFWRPTPVAMKKPYSLYEAFVNNNASSNDVVHPVANTRKEAVQRPKAAVSVGIVLSTAEGDSSNSRSNTPPPPSSADFSRTASDQPVVNMPQGATRMQVPGRVRPRSRSVSRTRPSLSGPAYSSGSGPVSPPHSPGPPHANPVASAPYAHHPQSQTRHARQRSLLGVPTTPNPRSSKPDAGHDGIVNNSSGPVDFSAHVTSIDYNAVGYANSRPDHTPNLSVVTEPDNHRYSSASDHRTSRIHHSLLTGSPPVSPTSVNKVHANLSLRLRDHQLDHETHGRTSSTATSSRLSDNSIMVLDADNGLYPTDSSGRKHKSQVPPQTPTGRSERSSGNVSSQQATPQSMFARTLGTSTPASRPGTLTKAEISMIQMQLAQQNVQSTDPRQSLVHESPLARPSVRLPAAPLPTAQPASVIDRPKINLPLPPAPVKESYDEDENPEYILPPHCYLTDGLVFAPSGVLLGMLDLDNPLPFRDPRGYVLHPLVSERSRGTLILASNGVYYSSMNKQPIGSPPGINAYNELYKR